MIPTVGKWYRFKNDIIFYCAHLFENNERFCYGHTQKNEIRSFRIEDIIEEYILPIEPRNFEFDGWLQEYPLEGDLSDTFILDKVIGKNIYGLFWTNKPEPDDPKATVVSKWRVTMTEILE